MRLWVAAVALTACGGGRTQAQVPAPPAETVEMQEASLPTEPPAEKEPVILHAKAEMTPAKGSKLEPFVVGFMQRQGDNALVLAELPVGVRPGRYRYVVHDGAACAKPGAAWAETKDAELELVVLQDLTGAIENTELAVHLDGDATLIGHTLVLHEDKKGKPGNVLACGPIVTSDE